MSESLMAAEFDGSLVGSSSKGPTKFSENASGLPSSFICEAVYFPGSPPRVSKDIGRIAILGQAANPQKETGELCEVLLVKDSKDSEKEMGCSKGLVVDSQELHWQKCTLIGEENLQVGLYEEKQRESSICAICLQKVMVDEISLVKGCDHLYCVSCILRWASYKADPWCPQCRLPFSSLYLYKSLDGSLNDFLVEESVCLLLRATWFEAFPSTNESEEQEDYLDEDDCYDEYHYTSNVRLGNRRWGDSGYVRAGRKEARPVSVRQVPVFSNTSSLACGSSSTSSKQKTSSKESVGRRAKRAERREAADSEGASKSQGGQKQHQKLKGRRAQY